MTAIAATMVSKTEACDFSLPAFPEAVVDVGAGPVPEEEDPGRGGWVIEMELSGDEDGRREDKRVATPEPVEDAETGEGTLPGFPPRTDPKLLQKL